MPSSTPHSTLLENLQLGGEGASLQLEGQRVELRGGARDPAVSAFHAFYLGAMEDYRVRHGAPARPGLLQRVRSWFARLLGAGAAAPPSDLPPENFGPGGPVRSPALPGPPTRPPEPVRTDKSAKPPPPEAKAEPPGPIEIKRGRDPAFHPDRNGPQLRAAYADRAGVHLLWQAAPDRESDGKIELIYDLDSAVARRLQECYGQLSKLGYKVTGLELLQPEAAPASARPVTPPPPPEPSAGAVEKASAAKSAAVPEGGRSPSLEKKERTLVMRLHPAAPEEPNRALVAPVENRENLQVLVAPERLVRALYAAADSAQPPDQRVTYLRCALGKSGLKAVEVGLGEGREHGPARWEEIAAWWEAAQKLPGPAAKKLPPAPGPDPVRGPELGLF